MGVRSKVTRLPPEVRAWLESALVANGFTQYELLEKEMRAKGFDISHSAIHRHGAALEKKLAAIRDSTEAARQIAGFAPDDEDQRSAAVINMVRMKIFDMLVSLKAAKTTDDPAQRAKLLSTLAKGASELSRVSIAQKRHAREVRAKVRAAAEKVARIAKRDGMSLDLVDQIRREILGISVP